MENNKQKSSCIPFNPKLIVSILITSILILSNYNKAQAIEIEKIGASTVDEKTLTFAKGPATNFGLTVNGRTHQQDPLITYKGYQYVTYFNADRRVCIGRRKLPTGQWNVIKFEDHRFETNDSHNTAVLGICHKDGTIHMAFDHHATKLNYRVSKPGAANNPSTVNWNASLFGEVLHTLGSVKTDKRVTYPRFFSAPNGNLMFYYRNVTSANGNGMIEEYDGSKKKWTTGLGKFISKDIGSLTVNGKESLFRCPYLNSISYSGKRLHVSWIWRDRFEKTKVQNQHSLCYTYSDDNGRTWHNSDGKIIGKTGTSYIHLNSPGLTVSPIPINSGLSNQNTHYAYPDGSIHIMMIQNRNGKGRKVYHHHWRTSKGLWKHEVLPFKGLRPKLIGLRNRSLILAYTSNNQLNLVAGKPLPKNSGWKWTRLKLPEPHPCFGDALLDPTLIEISNVLSIYSQNNPATIIKTKLQKPMDGHPVPLKVIDYRIK